jgi:hypothetical protein
MELEFRQASRDWENSYSFYHIWRKHSFWLQKDKEKSDQVGDYRREDYILKIKLRIRS